MLSRSMQVCKLVVALGFGFLISGCASPYLTPAKDIVDDQSGYLSRTFTPQLVSPNISKSVPLEKGSMGVGRLKVSLEITSNDNIGNKTLWKEATTYINSGNGLFQELNERSTNGAVSLLAFRLSYKGLVNLRQQKVPTNGPNADQLFEITKVNRFDAIPSTVGKQFVIDYTLGFVRDGATYHLAPLRIACNTTRIFTASDIHKKLAGQALEFECQTSSGKDVLVRQKWALLQSYGFAVILSEMGSAYSSNRRVVDIGN